jgi:hypothetical protein
MTNEVLEILTNGEIKISGRLIDASNATLFGSVIFNEKALPIVYKPIAGERPLWDFPDGNLASREVAAYRISKHSFDLVPPTIKREGPFGLGAVQLWIDTPENFDPISIGSSKRDEIRKMALFDIVINNTDRKFGHILQDLEGRIYGCDHGVSLHTDWKLRTVIWQFAGMTLSGAERLLLANLESAIRKDALHLGDLLTDSEILGIVERVQKLHAENKFPTPDQDWPAVPWPPV